MSARGMVYDSMNGVQGPYARRVFIDELGAPEFSGSKCSQHCQEGMSQNWSEQVHIERQTRALAGVFHYFISNVFHDFSWESKHENLRLAFFHCIFGQGQCWWTQFPRRTSVARIRPPMAMQIPTSPMPWSWCRRWEPTRQVRQRVAQFSEDSNRKARSRKRVA